MPSDEVWGDSMGSRLCNMLQELLVLGFLVVFSSRDGIAAQQPPPPAAAPLHVSPAIITLDNPEATQQILVRSPKSSADLTRLATYEVLDPKLASVDAAGMVQPKAEGRTAIVVRHGQ